MESSDLVFGAHALVGAGLVAFGAYRISLGRVVPGALNVAMAAVIVAVGAYVRRLA
ncbi:MAG: hypothetical protein ABEJ34_05510 [Haloferacaceae archaeon]